MTLLPNLPGVLPGVANVTFTVSKSGFLNVSRCCVVLPGGRRWFASSRGIDARFDEAPEGAETWRGLMAMLGM